MVGSQFVPSVVSRRAPQPFFRVFRGLGWGSVLLCCCGCVGVWGRVWFLVRFAVGLLGFGVCSLRCGVRTLLVQCTCQAYLGMHAEACMQRHARLTL